MYIQITTYPPFQGPFLSASKLFSATYLCWYSRHYWLIYKYPIGSRYKVLGKETYNYLTPIPLKCFTLMSGPHMQEMLKMVSFIATSGTWTGKMRWPINRRKQNFNTKVKQTKDCMSFVCYFFTWYPLVILGYGTWR